MGDDVLALDVEAMQSIKGIESNVEHIGDLLESHIRQVQELPLPSEQEAGALALNGSADDGNWTTYVTANEPLPDGWASDLLHFQYMHTVIFVAILAALAINLGATLWLAFSDKWRS